MINLIAAASKRNVEVAHLKPQLGKNRKLLYSVNLHLQVAQVANEW